MRLFCIGIGWCAVVAGTLVNFFGKPNPYVDVQFEGLTMFVLGLILISVNRKQNAN